MKTYVKRQAYSSQFINIFVAGIVLTLSASVNADTMRLVLSHTKDTALTSVSSSSVDTEVSVQSEQNIKIENRCITTLDGVKELCAPVRVIDNTSSSAIVSSASLTRQSDSDTPVIVNTRDISFSVIEVDIGDSSLANIKETLENTGWYSAVEEDVKIYSVNPQSVISANSADTAISTDALLYNDPEFNQQTYLFSAEDELAGSDFLSLMTAAEASSEEQETIGVAVLDSGFFDIDEVTFEGGYSFINTPGSDFYADSDDDSCVAHATGVSSVIGAESNNGQNLAGAAGNVELHAFEVLDCGTGSLSDAADALNALAGIRGSNYPAYEHNDSIKVANLSFGGSSSGCSSFMQEAINNANDAGILVVVSAGNESISASSYEPANCENVVTVGSLDADANRSSFSNYGSTVDITAQGEDIIGMGSDGIFSYFWSGTSFSAPLVTSAATYLYRQYPDITPEMAEFIIKVSSKEIQGDDCSEGECGSGLVNAAAMAELAQQTADGDGHTLTYMLSDKSDCDQQWYLEHFGDAVALCAMLKLTFISELADDQYYQLYQVPQSDTSSEVILQDNITTSSLVLPKSDFDTSTYYYFVKTCDDDECYGSLPVDTSAIDDGTGSAICP